MIWGLEAPVGRARWLGAMLGAARGRGHLGGAAMGQDGVRKRESEVLQKRGL